MSQRRFQIRPQLVILEDRLCPSGSVAYLNGILTITDLSNANDNIRVSAASGNGAAVSSNLGAGTFAPVTAVVMDLVNGNDNVQVASLASASASISVGNGNNNINIGTEASIIVSVGGGNNNINTKSSGNVLITVIGSGNNNINAGTGVNGIYVDGNGNNKINAAGNGDSISVIGNGNNNINDNGTNDFVQVGGKGNNNVNNRGTGSVTDILSGTPFSINTTISAHLTSPTSTAGSISSGILSGTTQFSATFTDAQGDYVGTLKITTDDGTLTLADRGNLNTITGAFIDQLTVISGTGQFAGASGALTDQGTLNLQTGEFVDVSLTGVIYLSGI